MKDLKLKLTLWAIRYLLSREKHYNTISSDGQRKGIYDTYWIFIEEWLKAETENRKETVEEKSDDDELPATVKRSYNVELINGQLFRRQRRKDSSEKRFKAKKLEYQFLKDKEICVRHFFKSGEKVFDSAISAAIMRKLRLHWFFYLVGRLHLFVLRAKFRSVRDHRKVLAAINDLSLRGFTHIYSFTVARDLYGPHYGPNIDKAFEQEQKRLTGILETLEQQGALQSDRGGFKILPKATALRMEWDREIARERIQNWNIFLTLLLTAVLAVSSGFMAWFQYLGLEDKPF